MCHHSLPILTRFNNAATDLGIYLIASLILLTLNCIEHTLGIVLRKTRRLLTALTLAGIVLTIILLIFTLAILIVLIVLVLIVLIVLLVVVSVALIVVLVLVLIVVLVLIILALTILILVLIILVLVVVLVILIVLLIILLIIATTLILVILLVLVLILIIATATTLLLLILDELLGVGVVVLGFKIGRIQSQRLLERREGLLIPLLLEERIAQIVVRLRAIQITAGRVGCQRTENLACLVILLLLIERIAQIERRLVTAVAHPDSLLITLGSLIVIEAFVRAITLADQTAFRELLSLRIGRHEERSEERNGQI